MKNVHEANAAGGNGKSAFSFSFHNPQYLHILIEAFLLIVIFMYIRKNVRRLQHQIEDLKSIVQKQQETLHLHQQLLQSNYSTSHLTHSDIPPTTRPPPPSPNGKAYSRPLPSFETIATIFNVPCGAGNMETDPFPCDDESTTIVDTTPRPPEPLQAPAPSTITPQQEIEMELEKEILELQEEEQKHESMTTVNPVEVSPSPPPTEVQEDDELSSGSV
jgi:hypothetical protein